MMAQAESKNLRYVFCLENSNGCDPRFGGRAAQFLNDPKQYETPPVG